MQKYAVIARALMVTMIFIAARPILAVAGSDPTKGESTKQKTNESKRISPDESGGLGTETPGNIPEAEPGILLLEGQVTDYIGAGLRDVEVIVRRQGSSTAVGDVVATGTTDRLGDFRIRTQEPYHGDVVVTFSKESYSDLTHTLHIGHDDYPPYLAETLEGNLTFSGIVNDAVTGEPVAEAQVTVKSVYKDWEAVTDSAGRFTVKGIVPSSGEVVVEAAGFGRERRDTELGPDSKDFVVQLKPERIVRALVMDESGRPVPNATLEIFEEARNDFRALVTDDRGAITIRGLHYDAEKIGVRLTHEDFVSSIGFDREILPPRDKAESQHRFTMIRAGVIVGRITNAENGKALYGVRLVAGETSDDDAPRDWSDVEGKYRITGVAPGKAVITAHMSGFAPELALVEVKSGDNSRLDLRMGAPRVLNGVVKNKSGDPVQGAQVEASKWRNFNTLGLRAITDDAGRFAIDNAPADEFEITVYARTAKPTPQLVTAVPGRITEIEIDVVERLDHPQAAKFKVGMQAPPVTFKTLDGQTIELSSMKGKAVVLDFWATWCGPCITELPKIKALHDQWGTNEQFALIGISLDWDKKSLQNFVKAKDIKWPQVLDSENASLADTFGVIGIPSIFLIGLDGKIDAVDPRPEDLAKRIDQLLKAK